MMMMNREGNARRVLPSARQPTVIIRRVNERVIEVEHARDFSRETPSAEHVGESERALATMLFTDIVDSTEHAAALGDRRWRELLESYLSLVRYQLGQFRGREIDTAGDGFFASFDGPARAIRCAVEVRGGAERLGLEIRAGVHTGECEIIGEKLGGIAVHVGARVAREAAPGEIVVSQTVKDLVLGSGLTFAERGAHALKGVPGEWRLYAFTGWTARGRRGDSLALPLAHSC
jgi:class 3 adenylate cyclase